MKLLKVFLSIIIVALLLAFIFIIPVMAGGNTETANPEDKISKELKVVMKQSGEDDLISVWIWFTDIDSTRAEKRIAELTGISRSGYKSKRMESNFDSVELKKEISNNSLHSFLASKDTDNYQTIRMNVYNEMYAEYNTFILNSHKIAEENILYQCNMTPSAIITVSVSKIRELATSNKIVSIYYYNENEINTEELNKTTLRYDTHLYDMDSLHFTDMINEYDYSGKSINTLVIGGFGYAGDSDLDNLNINNPNTVYNYYDNHMYCITDINNLPDNTNSHVNHVVKQLKQYAPDCLVMVTDPFDYSSIRSLLNSGQIDIICISAGYGEVPQYYDATSKWFDIISTTYDITVIASSGNNGNYPSVLSPSKGYNTIATGAFMAKSDMTLEHMYDYQYTFPTMLSLAQNKPDVILPTYDTSTASPVLSGIMACAIEANHDLRRQPEAQKAVVMASCHRKVLKCPTLNDLQETMEQGLTLKQGAGVVDAYRIIRIAREETFDYGLLSVYNPTYTSNMLPHNNVNYEGSIEYDDKLNTSLVWMINGELGLDPDLNNTTVNPIQDLTLEVLDGSNVVASSNTINTCKQMAYYSNGMSEQSYSIRVKNVTNANDRQRVYFGYAWCEKGSKGLTSVSLYGNIMSGQTLSACVFDNTNSVVSDFNNYEYHWQRSSDGIVWSNDIGNGSTYQLNDTDMNCYIKCTVVPLDCSLLSNHTVQSVTSTKVVKCGDLNFDNEVSSSDVTLIQNYLADLVSLTSEQLVAADVNIDGVIDNVDATILLRYIDGIITNLPFV